MVKVDFGKVMVQHNIEGELQSFDFRKALGNEIHQTTGDIGFDDFAHKIYFSEGAIEVPEEYIEPLKEIIKGRYLASVQKAFAKLLTIKE
jgi:hypothetical protein